MNEGELYFKLKTSITNSNRYHPDMNPDDDSSHEKFLLINEAYSVLGNELKRREYDRELASTRNSFNHPSGYEGGGGGFTGYSGSGRRGNQEWSSRSYREKLNPDDFMLHRRKRGESEPFGSRPGFNFTAHQEGHYGGGGGADSVARKRMYQRMYYKQLYEERSWRNSAFPAIFLIGSSLTLLFSDFFKLLWM